MGRQQIRISQALHSFREFKKKSRHCHSETLKRSTQHAKAQECAWVGAMLLRFGLGITHPPLQLPEPTISALRDKSYRRQAPDAFGVLRLPQNWIAVLPIVYILRARTRRGWWRVGVRCTRSLVGVGSCCESCNQVRILARNKCVSTHVRCLPELGAARCAIVLRAPPCVGCMRQAMRARW